MFKSVLMKRQFFSILTPSIVVLFIITAVLFRFSYMQTVDKIAQRNEMTVSLIKNNIDKEIINMANIGNAISQDNNVIAFLDNADASLTENYEFLTQSQKLLRTCNQQWNSNIFILVHKNNHILISGAYYEAEIYLENVARYENISAEEFLQKLKSVDYATVLGDFSVGQRNDGIEKCVLWATPIYHLSSGRRVGTTVIEIDYNRFVSEIDDKNKNESIYLMNSNKDIIFQYGTRDFPQEILEKLSEKKYILLDDRYYYVIPSDMSRWRYVCAFDASALKGGLLNVVCSFIMVFIAVLLFIMLVGLYLTRQMYKPVQKLMNKYGAENTGNIDEYAFIDEELGRFNKENRDLKADLERNREILKNRLVNSLLNGEMKSVTDSEVCKVLKIKQLYEVYQVIVVAAEYSEGCKDLVDYLQTKAEEQTRLLPDTGFHSFFVRKKDDLFVILLNINENDIDTDKVYNICDTLVEIARMQNVFVTVGVGKQYEGISNISKSYVEAFFACGKKNTRGYNCVISFEELDKSELENRFIMTDDKEKVLVNAVKIGAVEQMDEIFNEILHSADKDEMELRSVCNILVVILMRIVSGMELDTKEIFGDEFALRRILLNEETKDSFEYIVQMYRQTALYLSQNKDDRYEKVYRDVLRIVENEYANEINLNEIAQRLYISPSYISWIFKKMANMNFSDYIAKFRIEKAKEFLRSGKYSVAEVGKAVGVPNSNTFIRIFKKYEGITPGVFKSNDHI